jgi:hypothetical protein
MKLIGIFFAFLNSKTIQSGLFGHYFIKRQINNILKSGSIDLVVFHLFRNFVKVDDMNVSHQHIDLCDAQSRTYTDILSSLPNFSIKKLVFGYELAKTIQFENYLLESSTHSVSVINDADRNLLISRSGNTSAVRVLPNDFYLDFQPIKAPDNRNLVIVGNFKALHNRKMIEILSRINNGSVRLSDFQLVGQMSASFHRKYASKGFQIAANPPDIYSAMKQVSFGLCYLPFSAGFQTKLLDYANAGLVPIVSDNVAKGANLRHLESCIVIESLTDIPSVLNMRTDDIQRIVNGFRNDLIDLSTVSVVNWHGFLENV